VRLYCQNLLKHHEEDEVNLKRKWTPKEEQQQKHEEDSASESSKDDSSSSSSAGTKSPLADKPRNLTKQKPASKNFKKEKDTCATIAALLSDSLYSASDDGGNSNSSSSSSSDESIGPKISTTVNPDIKAEEDLKHQKDKDDIRTLARRLESLEMRQANFEMKVHKILQRLKVSLTLPA
jgi:hypothetical protein